MWSDNETALDLLGFQHLVAGLVGIARNDDLLPATIGVFGDWGSGKSSLLRMATAELEKDKDALVLTFNGWLFEDYGDAKAALMGNILDALAEQKTLTPKAKKLAVRLLKRVNWWRVLGATAKAGIGFAVAGPAGAGLLACTDIAALGKDLLKKAEDIEEGDLTKYLNEDVDHEIRRGIREFRADFAELLSETDRKKLVVIIDDLDRCLPETIIETLEAIKLFLFVDHTAFVIGADERLVRYAVRRRFPELPGERAEVGRDYLEKLVQFPIRVPPLGRQETETYIGLLFAHRAEIESEAFEKLRLAAVECDPETLQTTRLNQELAAKILDPIPGGLMDDLSLTERIAPVLATENLGNPRQCKRFLNMLTMRLGMAHSRGVKDLQPRLLAKLMLLEYYRTESFRQLAAAQAEENGRPAALAQAEKRLRVQETGTPTASDPTPARSKKASPGETKEPPEAETAEPLWLMDPWVTRWIKMDPPLAGEDLRPYFYFSRDLLGSLGTAAQRMSPSAQEALTMLSSESEAVRNTALKRAEALSPSDAHAVFESLAARVRQEDDLTAEGSALELVFSWVKVRQELLGQLVALLSSIPHTRIPRGTPMKLLNTVSKGDSPPVRKLLSHWSQSSDGQLKAAADAALKRHAKR